MNCPTVERCIAGDILDIRGRVTVDKNTMECYKYCEREREKSSVPTGRSKGIQVLYNLKAEKFELDTDRYNSGL